MGSLLKKGVKYKNNNKKKKVAIKSHKRNDLLYVLICFRKPWNGLTKCTLRDTKENLGHKMN